VAGERYVRWLVQNESVAQRVTKDAAAYEAKITTEDTALHTKWGQAYDKNVQIAQGSVAELGIKPEAVNALEKVLGFAGVIFGDPRTYGMTLDIEF
jgi:hypothetical protein